MRSRSGLWLSGVCALCIAAMGCSSGGGSGSGGDDGGTGNDGGSGSDGGGGDGGTGISLADYCTGAVQLWLGHEFRCRKQPDYDPSNPDDVARELSRCLALQGEVDSGDLRYDPVAAACVQTAQLPGTECQQLAFSLADFCPGVFSPGIAPGGSCWETYAGLYASTQLCQSGFCQFQDTCPGTCTSYVAAGQTCNDADLRCDPSVDWCDSGTCKALPGQGQSCTPGSLCAHGLYCFGSSPGTCEPPIAPGADCSTGPCPLTCIQGTCTYDMSLGGECYQNEQCPAGDVCNLVSPNLDGTGSCTTPVGMGGDCTGRECRSDLFCDFSTHKCKAYAGLGDDCTSLQCGFGLWCRQAPGATTLACAPQGGDGDACSDARASFPHGAACQGDLICMDDGHCHPQGGVSDPCTEVDPGSCQVGLWCSAGTCRAPAAMGEGCNFLFADTCAYGLGCACGRGDPGVCDTPDEASDTCQPLKAPSVACLRYTECASGNCDGTTLQCGTIGYCPAPY